MRNNMKKIVLISLVLLVADIFVSCKKSGKVQSIQDKEEPVNAVETSSALINDKIDYDWSKMNYNMLSSLFFDVQVNPEKYNGKRFKVSGNFHTSVYEENRYFSVLVWDATGCCPTGLDFVPPSDMNFPEDFPAMDEEITVTCTLNYFVIDGLDYFEFIADTLLLA